MVLDPSRVALSPWRNGAGATRELAVRTGPDGPGSFDGRVEWRISLADLDSDAPFSAYPGMNRLFVALGVLRLTVDDVEHVCRVGDQVRFPGEASASVRITTATRALNVMTRRGRFRAEVVLQPAGPPGAHPASARVLLGDRAADAQLIEETDG
jgi:environmental stress-induced protein Ves